METVVERVGSLSGPGEEWVSSGPYPTNVGEDVQVADIITAIATVVAAIAAIAAVIVAVRARGTSASANITAKDANSIARQARDAAKESNSIAVDANRLSGQAIQDAKDAQVTVQWHGILRCVNEFLNFDPLRRDVGPLLTDLRHNAMVLIDETDWPGLDTWMTQGQGLGTAIGREILEKARANRPCDIHEELALTEPMRTWALAYLNNLRFLRKSGPGPDTTRQLKQLEEAAAQNRADLFKRYGWGEPPQELMGVEPLA